MASTENSDKPFISPDLLDHLIREYYVASGTFHEAQGNLLREDPDTVMKNLQIAHGMGHILKEIMVKIPKEIIYECPNREHLWYALTGTKPSGDRGEGRPRVPTQNPSGPSRGSSGEKSFIGR